MKISDIVQETGLTQAQIARRLKVHRSAVNRWAERGIPEYRAAQMRELIADVRAEKGLPPFPKPPRM